MLLLSRMQHRVICFAVWNIVYSWAAVAGVVGFFTQKGFAHSADPRKNINAPWLLPAVRRIRCACLKLQSSGLKRTRKAHVAALRVCLVLDLNVMFECGVM